MSQVKTYKIREFGDPVLRQVALPISPAEIASQETKELVSSLKATLLKVGGIGLAAPQIGVSKRVFIIGLDILTTPNPQSEEEIENKEIKFTVCINPEIVRAGSELELDWEGCLSAPGWWGMVNRPTEISVKYLNESGQEVQTQLHGYIARVFQHELDHLDGVLFVDRMSNMSTLMTEREFRKRIK